jgi:membrane-associated phospholipid phosphatase
MRKIVLILFFIGQFEIAWTQNKTSIVNQVYQLNHKIEIPVTLGIFAANAMGLYVLLDKTPLSSSQVASLDKKDIWFFDRIAIEQTYDANYHKNTRATSDWLRNTSVFLPVILSLDKNIRKDIYSIAFLYLETQAIGSSLFIYAGVTFIDRIRPFAYYPEVPLGSKIESDAGVQSSFFSGHTSAAATASFFLAKVYIDYHPEIKRKKWLLYAGALIPPASVGYYRYKALRHFPSDIIVGIIAGAAAGILVPELHKIQFGKKQNFSILPFAGNSIGLSINIKM